MRILCLSILVILALLPVPAAAQRTCDPSVLDEASNAYDFGLFTRSFAILQPCLENGFQTRAHRAGAYRLIALSYVAMDSLSQAREWVRRLLDVDARYRPDPLTEPPIFVDYVRDLKPRWYTWLWRGGEWYHWAGRGLLVAGAASIPLLIVRESEPDLPGPPGLPSR